MSKLVSLYVGQANTRLEGYMLSNGEIHYSWIRNGRNTGTIDVPKEQLIKDFKMECKLDIEEEEKEMFDLLGFTLL